LTQIIGFSVLEKPLFIGLKYMASAKKQKSNKVKTALQCLGIAACVLLFFSCLSFDIADRPSTFVFPIMPSPQTVVDQRVLFLLFISFFMSAREFSRC
jgi:hypothetical protein